MREQGIFQSALCDIDLACHENACNDGNDNDSLTDCADPDCAGVTLCP